MLDAYIIEEIRKREEEEKRRRQEEERKRPTVEIPIPPQDPNKKPDENPDKGGNVIIINPDGTEERK